MYGTVMRAKLKSGHTVDELVGHYQTGSSDHVPHGLLSLEVMSEAKDPSRVLVAVRFRDKDAYIANADRPETDAQYRQMLEILDGAPEWIDVHFVSNIDHVAQSAV